MTSVLDYLRQGFEVLEKIPKDDFDKLLERIRLYRTNPEKVTPDELQELVSLTSHFYGLTGSKIAQIYAIKCSLERQIERRKIRLAQQNNIALNRRAELERLALVDPDSERLIQQLDETKAVELYFHNMRETLFMSHYALRKENDFHSTNSNNQASRMRVNYGS